MAKAEGIRKFDHPDEGHYTQWPMGQFGTVSVYDDGAILGGQGRDMTMDELREALSALSAAVTAAETNNGK